MNVVFESKPSQRIDTYSQGFYENSQKQNSYLIIDDRKVSYKQSRPSQNMSCSELIIAQNLMQSTNSEVTAHKVICQRLKKENTHMIKEFVDKYLYSKSTNIDLKAPQSENLQPQIKNIIDYTGSKYVGVLSSGQAKHGKGILITVEECIYFGDFYQNKKQGTGIEIKKSQERYEGAFIAGERSGVGTIYYVNGDSYTGQFENGQKNGQGKYTFYDNCQVFVGIFKNDKKEGKGKVMSLSGNIVCEGIYRDDQLITQRIKSFSPSLKNSSNFHTLENTPQSALDIPDKKKFSRDVTSQHQHTQELLSVPGEDKQHNHIICNQSILSYKAKGKSNFISQEERDDLAQLQMKSQLNMLAAQIPVQKEPLASTNGSFSFQVPVPQASFSPPREQSSSCCCSLFPNSLKQFFGLR